jgi:hypothetical protein
MQVVRESLIGEILGSGAGLIISFLLLRLARQTSHNQEGRRSRLAFALCVLVNTGSTFAYKGLLQFGVPAAAASARWVNFLIFASGAVWPVAAFHLWGAGLESGRRDLSH